MTVMVACESEKGRLIDILNDRFGVGHFAVFDLVHTMEEAITAFRTVVTKESYRNSCEALVLGHRLPL
jgi:hypothetical protein